VEQTGSLKEYTNQIYNIKVKRGQVIIIGSAYSRYPMDKSCSWTSLRPGNETNLIDVDSRQRPGGSWSNIDHVNVVLDHLDCFLVVEHLQLDAHSGTDMLPLR